MFSYRVSYACSVLRVLFLISLFVFSSSRALREKELKLKSLPLLCVCFCVYIRSPKKGSPIASSSSSGYLSSSISPSFYLNRWKGKIHRGAIHFGAADNVRCGRDRSWRISGAEEVKRGGDYTSCRSGDDSCLLAGGGVG